MDELKRKKYLREYRQKNKAAINEVRQQWRLKNPDKVKKYLKKQGKDRCLRNRQMFSAVKAATGCCNPACCWKGPLPPCCLDFHHINDDKEFSIAACSSLPVKKLIAEMKKCTVLCAICHRLATWNGLDTTGFVLCKVDRATLS